MPEPTYRFRAARDFRHWRAQAWSKLDQRWHWITASPAFNDPRAAIAWAYQEWAGESLPSRP